MCTLKTRLWILIFLFPNFLFGQSGLRPEEQELLDLFKEYYLNPDTQLSEGKEGFFSALPQVDDVVRNAFFTDAEVQSRLRNGQDYIAKLSQKAHKQAMGVIANDLPDVPFDSEKQLVRQLGSRMFSPSQSANQPLSQSQISLRAMGEVLLKHPKDVRKAQAQRLKEGKSSSSEEAVRNDPHLHRLFKNYANRIEASQEGQVGSQVLDRRAWELWRIREIAKLQKYKGRIMEASLRQFPPETVNDFVGGFLDGENGIHFVEEDGAKKFFNIDPEIFRTIDFSGAQVEVLPKSKILPTKNGKFYPGTIVHLKNGKKMMMTNQNVKGEVYPSFEATGNFEHDPIYFQDTAQSKIDRLGRKNVLQGLMGKMDALQEVLEKTKWRAGDNFLPSLKKSLDSAGGDFNQKFFVEQLELCDGMPPKLCLLMFDGWQRKGWDYWKKRFQNGGRVDPLGRVNQIQKKYGLDEFYIEGEEPKRPSYAKQVVASNKGPINSEIESDPRKLFQVQGDRGRGIYELIDILKKPKVQKVNLAKKNPTLDATIIKPFAEDGRKARPRELLGGRYLIIPTPVEKDITQLSVWTPEGKKLVLGKDFLLKKEIGAEGLLVEVLHPTSEAVNFEAHFQPSKEKYLDSKTVQVSPTRLKSLTGELRKGKIYRLADLIDAAAASGKTLTLYEVEKMFQSVADYAHGPGESNLVKGSGLYANLAKFLQADGRFCYQCDGADELSSKFLKQYYKDSATAEVKSLLVLKAEDDILNTNHAHALTSVTLKGKRVLFDATPKGQTGVLALARNTRALPISTISVEDGEEGAANAEIVRVQTIIRKSRKNFLELIKLERFPIVQSRSEWLYPYRVLGLYDRFLNGELSPSEFLHRSGAQSRLSIKDYKPTSNGIQRFMSDFVSQELKQLRAKEKWNERHPRAPLKSPGFDPRVMESNREMLYAFQKARDSLAPQTFAHLTSSAPAGGSSGSSSCSESLKKLGQYLTRSPRGK